MPQQHQQELQKINHSLSRLALAKAIKTPDDLQSEPWQKSVIFNQPFIKELHQKKQQLYTNPPSSRREIRSDADIKKDRLRKSRSNSSSIEKRLSELNIKKSAELTKKQRSCLPSDSEEEEDDDTRDSEDEDSDSSEVLEVKGDKRPTSTSPEQLRPTSLNSSRDDISTPSRGSTSSNAFPLTDEDEVDSTPTAPLHHIRSNSWALPHTTNDNVLYNGPQQKPLHHHNNNMIDPMYYQRVQQYQQQLQYQLQYQQALALQQQQQQQLYMLSQSPSAFFPPGSRVAEDPASMIHSTKRNSGGSQQHVRNTGGHKISKTDLRRREEMLRSSSESMHRLPPSSQQQAMYYQQQLFTPSIMKSNNRRPSYNL